MSQDAALYRNKIETEIAKLIEEKLKAGQMAQDRARQIAKYVLEALSPHMSMEQIHTAVQNFDEHFPELLPAILPIIAEFDEKIKKVVLAHVETLIKEKKIDQAVSVLNKALGNLDSKAK